MSAGDHVLRVAMGPLRRKRENRLGQTFEIPNETKIERTFVFCLLLNVYCQTFFLHYNPRQTRLKGSQI